MASLFLLFLGERGMSSSFKATNLNKRSKKSAYHEVNFNVKFLFAIINMPNIKHWQLELHLVCHFSGSLAAFSVS